MLILRLRKSGLSLNPDIHHSKVPSSDTTHCSSQSIFIFQESDSGLFLFANQEALLSHCNQSRVLFQPTFILISMLQVKLMNIITSFALLFTIVVNHNTGLFS